MAGQGGMTAAAGAVLRDRVALITGAASGIGRAAAILFADAGARVIVADRTSEAAERTVELVRAKGGYAAAVCCDISVEQDVQAMIAFAVETYGRIDCAFNNAGAPSTEKAVQDYSLNAWNRALSVNLTGTWLCMKYELEQMLRQGGQAAVVNNASAWALVGWSRAAPYVAAKHGVVGLTKSAALDHAGSGIRINAVCPGLIETPMSNGMPADAMHAAISEQPMRRKGQPVEVAQAALWLCSDAASFVTGAALIVDGAWTV